MFYRLIWNILWFTLKGHHGLKVILYKWHHIIQDQIQQTPMFGHS